MFESKALLKKKIEELKEDARKRELYISDMHSVHSKLEDGIRDLGIDNYELKEKNKQLLQENVDLLLRMRKILKDEVRK